MFDKFTNRYTVKGRIKAQTAIYIGGSRENIVPSGIDNQFIKDTYGRPFIPGSTIKGIARSFLERLLLTLGKDVCTIPDLCSDKFKNKEQRDKMRKGKNEEEFCQEIYQNLCIVCRLFGSGVNSSKLFFRDAKVIPETFKSFELRNGVSIDRDKNIAVPGYLYEIEVVPGDSEFSFELLAENLEEEEKKYLYILLKAMEMGELQIGGLTSRGLGKFTLEGITIDIINKNNIFSALLTGKKDSIGLDDFYKVEEV